MFLWYQTKPDGEWIQALAEERASLLANPEVVMVTALDMDNPCVADMTLADKISASYSGPFYIDIDDENDRKFTIVQLQTLLEKLTGMGVDGNCLRIYATGKKGFHVEVPEAAMHKKVPPNGTKGLFNIYKGMARALEIEGVDMRVYSFRRMWRVPSRPRTLSDDRVVYKVQITYGEALQMTEEMYDKVVAQPRHPIATAPATYSTRLALAFATAKNGTDEAAKKARAKKADKPSPLRNYAGEWPPSVRALLNGKYREDSGWNAISMQLAIVAHELGIPYAKLREDAEPLLREYKGDSKRYDNYRRRENELRGQYHFMSDNPAYSFEIGPLVRVIAHGVSTDDLCAGDIGAADLVESAGEDGESTDEYMSDIKVLKKGIFVKKEDVFVRASPAGWANPIQMLNEQNECVGYEVDFYVDAQMRSRTFIPALALTSRATLQGLFCALGTSLTVGDIQVVKLNDVLRKATEKEDRKMMKLTREGVDIIETAELRKQGKKDVVWVAGDRVISKLGLTYRFEGDASETSKTHCDLHKAEPWKDTPENRELMNHLLEITRPDIVAKFAGFFSAAFISQYIRRATNQYPYLQLFGQAGSGKSKTTEIFAHLHYHTQDPPVYSVGMMTLWSMIANVSQSASIPVVFEEFKPSEMQRDKLHAAYDIIKNNYTAANIERGTMRGSRGQQRQNVLTYRNSAPLVTLSESIEEQTALLDRCVLVPMVASAFAGREHHYDPLYDGRKNLGGFGRIMLESALAADGEKIGKEVNKVYKELYATVVEDVKKRERPIFNLAVVIVGLRFMRDNLRIVFGDLFDRKMQELEDVIALNVEGGIEENMCEAAKALNVMSFLSYSQDNTCRLLRNVDYTVDEERGYLDLKMRNAYVKYARHCKDIGQQPLFGNEEKFTKAMKNYGGFHGANCKDNPLLSRGKLEVIYRFDLSWLEKEKVEPFA